MSDERTSISNLAGPRRGKRTYVLVHGAWFGGWVWREVADALTAKGHVVHRPTMTGLGERRHLLRAGINLDTHTQDIVGLIEAENLTEVVLVGWSYGGMVISNVLARVTSRIASMVYLDAFVPERGRSQLSYATRIGTPEEMMQKALVGQDIPVFPLQGMGISDQAIVDYAMPRLGPHPIGTFLQASKALAERPAIPHTYIYAAGYPNPTFEPIFNEFKSDKLGDTEVLNTSHATMLTDPAGTIALLSEVR